MAPSLSTLDPHVKPLWTPNPGAFYRFKMGSKDITRRNVGLRLKAAREMRGMTQQFVADLFGVGKGTVSAWETGGGDPGIYRLIRLAKLYDVTADSLLWDEAPSMAAQRVAVGYDHLSDEKRKRFDAMWATHFADAVPDDEVARRFSDKSAGTYKPPGKQTPEKSSP